MSDLPTLNAILAADAALASLANYLVDPTATRKAVLVDTAYAASRQVTAVLAAAGIQSQLPGPQPEPRGALTRKLAGLPPEPSPEGGLRKRMGKGA